MSRPRPLGLSCLAGNDVAGIRQRRWWGSQSARVRCRRCSEPKQFAEVACAHERRRARFCWRQRRHGCTSPTPARPGRRACPLILVEVSGNEDRAVEVPAELVVAEGLPRSWPLKLRCQVLAFSALLRKYSKALPWKSAGAALGDHADLAAGGAAVLRRIAGGQDLYLRGGVHIRDADAGAVGTRTHHRRTVEGDEALLRAGAVDIDAVIQSRKRRPPWSCCVRRQAPAAKGRAGCGR